MSLFGRFIGAILASVMLGSLTASADQTLEREAQAALDSFTNAVVSGPDAVAEILAPEFQIMRSNGVGYDRDGYVASVDGVKVAPDFKHDEIVATTSGDLMVVRYVIELHASVDGEKMATRAPRLTVFRKIDGVWKVAAHANLATLGAN